MASYCAPSKTVDQHSLYELFGVVNHYGTLEGGHYTAHVRHKEHGVGRPPNPSRPSTQVEKKNSNGSHEDGFDGVIKENQTSKNFPKGSEEKAERWWCFDDEKVKRWRGDWWDPGKVKQYCAGQGLEKVPDPAEDDLPLDPSSAYILFYRRKPNGDRMRCLAKDMGNLSAMSS